MSDQPEFTFLNAPTISERFDRWAHTPGGRRVLQIAYAITAQYARRHKRTGRQVSIRLVWEKLRDSVGIIRSQLHRKGIKLEKEHGFALNDHFHSRLARHMLAHKPEWAGLFCLRELKEDHE